MQIKHSVFLIPGGASGLGAATARHLVAAGGKVLLADLNRDIGERFAASLGGSAKFALADVTNEGQVQQAIDAAVAAFGALHGLINCAGVAPGERVVGKNGPHKLESFSRVININLVGSFNALRLAANAMAKNPPNTDGERGVIINTASIAAFEGQIGQAAYSASKGGIVAMALPIARELAKLGIRVNTIAPGIFDTPMLQGMSEEIRTSLGAQVPFPSRLGQPEEYARLAGFIIENPLLNAEVIRLDGGIRMAAK
ncbi:MAG TPA: 3-hydroxyacyl-CoA dehydrogenase [Burkholderiales bacterium]|jgi:NAD(P)-dependent dehydrogenase (short-subunit alcohol dehydrogenase family)|nr:3-hydroxyacyl-CoA dehydrogenase [Burkholderiales bacterium]